MRIYLFVTGIVFLAIAGIHAARILLGWSAVVSGVQISIAVDVGTIVVALSLAFGAFWFATRRK